MHSMLWWSFPIQSILECLNCALTYCPQDGPVPLTERMESSQVGHPHLSTPFAEVHTWVCQPFQAVTRYIWVVMILGFDMHDACKQQLLRIGESRSGGCSRRLGVGGRGDPVFLDLANPPQSFLRRKVFPGFLPVFLVGKREEVNWFQIFVCQSCELGYWNCVPNIAEAVGSEKLLLVVCNANLDSFVEEKTWSDLHPLHLKQRLSRKYGSFLPGSPWFQVGLVQTWKSLGRPSPQGDFWDWPIFSENRSETVQKQTKELCWEKEPWKPRRGWRIWGGHYKVD